MVAGSSLKRLKRISWQNGFSSATRSITAISCSCAVATCDVELGLFIILAEAMDQLIAGGHALGAGHLRERVAAISECVGTGLGEIADRAQQRALPFMYLVKHRERLSCRRIAPS